MAAVAAESKRSVRVAAGASLFLAALLAALLFALSCSLPPVENDATDYLRLAGNIAGGYGFTKDGLVPEVYRPPLFSSLLGGWFLVTGTSSPLSAAVFQSLEHAAAVVVAFLLFLELTPSLRWATGAALFLALNPLLVTRVAFVLQEPTILLFTTVAAWCSVRFLGAPTGPRAAAAGAAWGFCTLAKVVSWYAPFLLLGIRLLQAGPRQGRRGAEAAILLLCFAAVIAPWTIRNYILFDRFIPVNDQGIGLLEWNVLQSKVPGGPSGAERVAEIRARNLPEDERSRMLWDYVLDRPEYFFGTRILENALRFASPSRSWWWARGMYGPGEKRPWYWTGYDYLHRFLFLFLLYRFAQAVRARCGTVGAFIALYGCAYWALYALAWGEGRFSLPIYPLLAAGALPWKDPRQ